MIAPVPGHCFLLNYSATILSPNFTYVLFLFTKWPFSINDQKRIEKDFTQFHLH